MTDVPDDLSYTAEHEWLSPASPGPGTAVTVGISAAACEQLGELVFAQLPDVGATLTAGAPCGEVESTKSVSELYSPVSGTVTEVNASVVDDPSVVNRDPYRDGWLFKVDVTAVGELLDPVAYRSLLGE